MADETIAAPVETPETPAPLQDLTAEVETEAPALDGDAPALVDDSEELEFEGAKYKLAKATAAAIKPHLMRDADYRHKTMELADQRRAHEETVKARQAEYETSQRYIEEIADIRAIDRQLGEYAKMTPADWNRFWDTEPIAAGKAQAQLQSLQNARQALVGQVQAKETERGQTAQREHAKRLEDARSTLARDIPGWSDELAGKIKGTASSAYGITEAELAKLVDPRFVRVLHDAHQYRSLIAKQRASTQAAQPPIAAVPSVGGSRTPATDLRSLAARSDPSDFIKARNKQTSKVRTS